VTRDNGHPGGGRRPGWLPSLRFFALLRWIDRRPLPEVIEPYRARLLTWRARVAPTVAPGVRVRLLAPESGSRPAELASGGRSPASGRGSQPPGGRV
jgi:hypothetical protein